MMAIQAHCHAGRIQLPIDGIPLDARVVVVFLPEDGSGNDALSAEQQAALLLQSQSGFARSVLLNPAEDCWNDV